MHLLKKKICIGILPGFGQEVLVTLTAFAPQVAHGPGCWELVPLAHSRDWKLSYYSRAVPESVDALGVGKATGRG